MYGLHFFLENFINSSTGWYTKVLIFLISQQFSHYNGGKLLKILKIVYENTLISISGFLTGLSTPKKVKKK